MQTIVTQRHFVFRNDKTGEICSVPRSPMITSAKKVPDWVLDTLLFKLAAKDKTITVVDVKSAEQLAAIPEAKVDKPVEAQKGAESILAEEAEAKQAETAAAAKEEPEPVHEDVAPLEKTDGE